jgi:hypothetical protein
MAMLDAILSPDWVGRYYSFTARRSGGGQRAAMQNGSGNEYSIVFSAAGASGRR